jgi:hypothetical protein
MPTTTTAWICVQVADLLRSTEELVLDALTVLGSEVHAGMKQDAQVVLTDNALGELTSRLADIAEAGERLRGLAERLPQERSSISYDEARAGAAADLAEGIVEPQAVLLAARVLDVQTGWTALAEALLSADVRFAWDSITASELLGRFRGADPQVVQGVIAEAGVSPEASLADPPDDQVACLASAVLRAIQR